MEQGCIFSAAIIVCVCMCVHTYTLAMWMSVSVFSPGFDCWLRMEIRALACDCQNNLTCLTAPDRSAESHRDRVRSPPQSRKPASTEPLRWPENKSGIWNRGQGLFSKQLICVTAWKSMGHSKYNKMRGVLPMFAIAGNWKKMSPFRAPSQTATRNK